MKVYQGHETDYGARQRAARESALAVRRAGSGTREAPAPRFTNSGPEPNWRHAELREKTLAQLPELQGDEAQHNEPLRAACDNVMTLLRQELGEGEPECVAMLAAILQSLVEFANYEAMEYDGDGYDDDSAGYGGDGGMVASALPPSFARMRAWQPASLKADPAGIVHKAFTTTIKALDEGTGQVEALVNTRDLDLQDDVMQEGCWQDVLKAARQGKVSWPAICWNHDWKDIRGKVVSAAETPAGLEIVGQYAMETQAGRDAFALVKGGYITQWSVGFEPDEAATTYEKGVRYIGRVKRWPEVSNVLLGASIGTMTTSAKGAGAGFVTPLDVEGEAMVEAFMAKHFGAGPQVEELVPSFIAQHSKDPAVSGPALAQRAAMETAANIHSKDSQGGYSDSEWDAKIQHFGGWPSSVAAGTTRRWTDENSPDATPRVPEEWRRGRVERMVNA